MSSSIKLALLMLSVSLGVRAADLMAAQPGTSITVASGAGPSGTGWTSTGLTNGWPCSHLDFDSQFYAEAIDRHIGIGGYHQESSEPDDDVHGYSYTENRCDILDYGTLGHSETKWEAGHGQYALSYMPFYNSLIFYGANSGANMTGMPYYMWTWDAVSRTGRNKTPLSRPGQPLLSSIMAYSDYYNKAVYWPNQNGTAGGASATDIYDVAANTWTQVGSGTVTIGVSAARAYNSNDHKAYFWGGLVGTCTYSADVNTFDFSTNTWAVLSITDDPIYGRPAGRNLGAMTYNPRDNEFLIGSGINSCTSIANADMWILKKAGGTWQWERIPDLPAGIMIDASRNLFSRVSYDMASNAYVVNAYSDVGTYANGTYNTYPSKFWAFCRSGCSNAGRSSPAYAVPESSLNEIAPTATIQSFAADTGIAVNGSTLYAGWVETGAPYDITNCGFSHPYVAAFSTAWSSLFSTCTAIDPNPYDDSNSNKLQLATIAGNLWSTHGVANNAAQKSRILAKQWNGTTWIGSELGARDSQAMTITSVTQGSPTTFNTSTAPMGTGDYVFITGASGGGWNAVNGAWQTSTATGGSFTIPVDSSGFTGSFNGAVAQDSAYALQDSNAIADVGGVPTFAFVEIDKDLYFNPQTTTVFVDQLPNGPGTTPTPLGGALNRNPLNLSWANEVSIASTGTVPIVAWTEQNMANTFLFAQSSQMYVSQWSGSAWTALGGALNQSGTSWAMDASITYMGGSPYAAWTERTVTGVPQVYVAKWNGSVWSRVGSGALNKDTALGWATRPRLTNDGVNVFVSWQEQNQNRIPRVYVSSWNGTVWTSLGGALNADTAYGSALGNSIVIFKGQPAVVFTEATPGNLRQAVLRQWNGSDWIIVAAAGTPIGGTFQSGGTGSGGAFH